MAYSKHILIVLFFGLMQLLNYQAESAPDSKILPLWSWECLKNKCEPVQTDAVKPPQSLTTCNMICTSMPLWPQPTGDLYISRKYVPVRAALINLEMTEMRSTKLTEFFTEVFNLFRQDLLRKGDTTEEYDWRSIKVRVSINESDEIRMTIKTDESYSLFVRPSGNGAEIHVDIKAGSFCGARHALATLSQLIWYDTYKKTLYAMTTVSIKDAPRYRYRGLMLDTTNRYIDVSEILEMIDGMGSCKFNTFHWHATDSQAFSLLLNSTRKFVEASYYDENDVYTEDDVRRVVQRARLRGVRVLVEVEAPAHVGRAWSWWKSAGFDDLAYCVNAEPWSSYCNEPPCGQLNPRNPHVYVFLEKIFAEIHKLTGVDDIVHLGGDGFSEYCWANIFTNINPQHLWLDYYRKILDVLQKVYKMVPSVVIMWYSNMHELLRAEMAKHGSNLTVQVHRATWTDKFPDSGKSVTSNEDVWKLDSGFGDWYDEDAMPFSSWQQVYEHRPWGPWGQWYGAWEGGEGTVWSAGLAPGGLGARVWPRAAALAERLWTDPSGDVTETVQVRLDIHRSRMIASGLKSAPMWSMWCTQNPRRCL